CRPRSFSHLHNPLSLSVLPRQLRLPQPTEDPSPNPGQADRQHGFEHEEYKPWFQHIDGAIEDSLQQEVSCCGVVLRECIKCGGGQYQEVGLKVSVHWDPGRSTGYRSEHPVRELCPWQIKVSSRRESCGRPTEFSWQSIMDGIPNRV